jgi:hypothetical protein
VVADYLPNRQILDDHGSAGFARMILVDSLFGRTRASVLQPLPSIPTGLPD